MYINLCRQHNGQLTTDLLAKSQCLPPIATIDRSPSFESVGNSDYRLDMGQYYFGIAGWSYPDWKGIVYPAETRNFDPLSYVATYFDTVELNNTFYRIPERKVVESWARRVSHNKSFQFTAKLWQGFTHEKEGWSSEDLKQFTKAVGPLTESGKLGALLAQYPGSFKNRAENREKLETLVGSFGDFPLVVEFRDRSWVAPEVLQWLEERQIGYCNVDEPMFRQMIKPSSVVTSPIAYVRFHGRNYKNWYAKEGNRDTRYDYLYTVSELDDWVPRLAEMKKKSGKVFVIGNNHFRGQAPANILQLKAKTERGPVDVPPSMFQAFPQLKEIEKKHSGRQESLFE